MADPQFPTNEFPADDDQTTGENVSKDNVPAEQDGGDSLKDQLTEDLSVQGGE